MIFMPVRMRPTLRAVAVLVLTLLAACAQIPRQSAALTEARQLVMVTTADWDASHGELHRFERHGRGWRAIGAAQPVTIGRNGSAWGVGLHPLPQVGPQKREGDGRAPAGMFAIGLAFGYESAVPTALDYLVMDADDWCIDVPSSPLYNRIVNAREVGAEAVQGSTEPMRRDLHADGDRRYVLGVVVEHNPQHTADAGSCIFVHRWKAPDETTAGCTALDEPALRELVAWLDRRAHPVFVLLPRAEYHARRAAWSLPTVPALR